MATPIAISQRTLIELKSLIWHYEDGLKSRIIALHRASHPNGGKSDGEIIHDELNKCRRSDSHRLINEYLNKMETGITQVSEEVQELKHRLAGKRQEYRTLCDKIHEHKTVIKDCHTKIDSMTQKDRHKNAAIATLRATLSLKDLELAELKIASLEKRQTGGSDKGHTQQDADIVLMDLAENELEQDVRVQEPEVEAAAAAAAAAITTTARDEIADRRCSHSQHADKDKIARWEEMTEKIIDELQTMTRVFSLSTSLAMQNDELRDRAVDRELIIRDLSREVAALRTLQYQSQDRWWLGYCQGAGMKEQQQQQAHGYLHTEGVPGTSSERAVDGETEDDIFEDCVSEQGEE